MSIQSISKMRSNRGFTMIELMLVMAIAAVMMSLKMQDDKLEMTQLQSRKLGATELFVYNLGVQKYVSTMAGEVPAPGDYPKVYTGVDWLKNDQCADPALPATPGYVPCNFLANSGGRTTLGAMTFTTTIDYSATEGYTARTVLSQMAGTAAGESNSGVLGMAALVASGAFIGSDASATAGGSGGSIIYCPDINPMPAGMAAVCGLARDQIVMIVNTNGNNDHWLRVDHGNVMQHAIEMSDTAGATPAMDSDLSAVHPNMRQIRNVARIYNVGAGNDNLYIGNRLGALAEVGQAGSPTTLASNAVIIDADQEILGFFKVQGNVHVTGGNIDLDSAGDPTKGNLTVERDITSTAGNATINGWISAANGQIRAETNGFMHALRYVDDDPNFYVDANTQSYLRDLDVRRIRANTNISSQLQLQADNIEIRSRSGGEAYLNGAFRVPPNTMRIYKNGRYYYIEDVISNLTYLGSHVARHGVGYRISTATFSGQCSYYNIAVYVDSMSEMVQVRPIPTWENNNGTWTRQYGKVGRWVTRPGSWYFDYYQRNLHNNGFGYYDSQAQAVLHFYCRR